MPTNLPRQREDFPRPLDPQFHPTRRSWYEMRSACLDPRHRRYARVGGRGITVCSAWQLSFARFVADMGYQPVGTLLGRHDEARPFNRKNCFWETAGPWNRLSPILVVDGVARTRGCWARRNNVASRTIRKRIEDGEAPETAVQKRAHCKLIECHGLKMSQNDWARHLGISGPTLFWRLRNWGKERALSAPKVVQEPSRDTGNSPFDVPLSRFSLLEFQGRTLTVAAWAQGLGISWRSLVTRIEKWDFEIAMTSPRLVDCRYRTLLARTIRARAMRQKHQASKGLSSTAIYEERA